MLIFFKPMLVYALARLVYWLYKLVRDTMHQRTYTARQVAQDRQRGQDALRVAKELGVMTPSERKVYLRSIHPDVARIIATND